MTSRKGTLVLVFISLMQFGSSTGCRENGVNFVFPENFEGWAVLITKCKNGNSLSNLDSHKQGEVLFPSNGIYIGNFDQPSGSARNMFFILEEGRRKKLLTPKVNLDELSKKLCSIIASKRAGFNPLYYSCEDSVTTELIDDLWEYDFVYFFIGNTCSSLDSFDRFEKEVSQYLVKNDIGSCY